MNKTIEHIEESLKKSYSYKEYKSLISDLLEERKSTTEGGSQELVKYSKLNLHRMWRWDKTFQIKPVLEKTIRAYKNERIWLIISEGWCGDAAHIVPVMNKMAELNSNINLRIVLREENENLMNDFLTAGSKSIPKLIIYNTKEQNIENTWGPRPVGATKLFKEYKDRDDFETTKEALQKWYNKDKGKSIAEELVALLKEEMYV